MVVKETEQLTREKLEKVRRHSKCATCGEWVNMYLDNEGNAFLACKDYHRTGHTEIANDYRKPKELNIPAWREKMTIEYGKETATALEKYRPSTGQLTQSQAMHILKLVYPRAPEDEIVRCAILCRDFGLHPLKKEVYLIPFQTKKGEEWATVVGIAADRKMAADRKGNFSFIDDSPRAAAKEEAIKQFGDDSEEARDNLISICKLQGEEGNPAIGFGLWPKNKEPYGTDKGNTKRNMANIRAERQALSRLPGKPLPQVEVIDEAYAELPDVSDKVNNETGEIIEAEETTDSLPEAPPEPAESKKKPPKAETSAEPPAGETQESQFYIDRDWLIESVNKMRKWNIVDYLKTVYEVDTSGTLFDIISRLTKEQQEALVKEIQDRLEML